MTHSKIPLTIRFLPGSFDGFEGTQEELDDFVAKITQMVESGELMENSTLVTELSDEEMDGLAAVIEQSLSTDNDPTTNKKIH